MWRSHEARRTVVAQALEYATSLFKMNYEDLENAVLNAKFVDAEKPRRLYDLFSDDPEALPEDKFIDRVNYNLINGRIVVLIVGDGIRTQLEDLYDGLQAHAKFQFTFALVEMPVFRCGIGETPEELIVTPRTLLKTAIVERITVRVEGGDTVQIEDSTDSDEKTAFYKAIEEGFSIELRKKLEIFVASLEPFDVYPEFLNSLNLKWRSREDKPVNLGYITKNGRIYTKSSYWFAPDTIAEQYNQRLARALGGQVKGEGNERQIISSDGSLFRVDEIVEKFGDWSEQIKIFINELTEHYIQSHD